MKKTDVPQNQRQEILYHLKFIGAASAAEFALEYGIFDSRKRISELRRKGVNILGREVIAKNRHGKKIRFLRYYLKGGRRGRA